MRLLAALALVCCCAALAGEIEAQRLPLEARETLERIQAGGPFPYRQDGRVFSNREMLLPRKARGYYREYTVSTPGARDRGARRIVAGSHGEYYYTDDHYRSFRRIRE
jgi:ribonuclease T1